MWTVFHPPTPFPFEYLPSACTEKQALLCFVCPSALTSHFLPVNCQCSKSRTLETTCETELSWLHSIGEWPRGIILCHMGTQEDEKCRCDFSLFEIYGRNSNHNYVYVAFVYKNCKLTHQKDHHLSKSFFKSNHFSNFVSIIVCCVTDFVLYLIIFVGMVWCSRNKP